MTTKNCLDHVIRATNKIIMLGLLIILGSFSLVFSCHGSSGQYLVASQAAGNKDFEEAAKNYLSILDQIKTDSLVLQEALIFSVLANNLDSTKNLLTIVEQKDLDIPSAGLISLARSYKAADFDRAKRILSKYNKSLPNFLSLLANGWTEIADSNLDSGIEIFMRLDDHMSYLGLYNCALAFAMNKDFKSATFYLDQLEGKKGQLDELQLRAQAQIYSNNDNNDKATLLLKSINKNRADNLFGNDLRELKAGKTLKFDVLNTPYDALASVFYLMSKAGDEKNRNLTSSIFYLQLAEFISEGKDYYNVRLAETFSRMKAHGNSRKKYQKIPNNSIFYFSAQLGVADTLVEDGRNDNAIDILQTLINQGYNEFILFDSLADIYRAKEDYETAIKYYDKALSTLDEKIETNKWATFFVRGISHDQSGDWEKAKVDLRTALRLYPNHPEVLNYFGYSLIERTETLDEALGMIEEAVLQKPSSGYIIDSLAWGLFRLGKYNNAIVPMEKATELEPHDPIINDHLGDVLWMVGRKREAVFQWNRALLFGPTQENEKKIKEKLRFGLSL